MTDHSEPEIPPPAPSSLKRMRDAAARRATSIEGSQVARIKVGFITAPDPEMLRERDDFDAIMRLLDKISADPELREAVTK